MGTNLVTITDKNDTNLNNITTYILIKDAEKNSFAHGKFPPNLTHGEFPPNLAHGNIPPTSKSIALRIAISASATSKEI